MRKTIKTVHTIDAANDRVWELISRGDHVEDWLPIIGSSRLGADNRRFCTLQDGASLEETVLKSDHLQLFMYSIDKQESFPVNQAVGTMRLEAVENATKLYWDLEFDLAVEEAEAEFRAAVEEIYASGAQKLGELANQSVAA